MSYCLILDVVILLNHWLLLKNTIFQNKCDPIYVFWWTCVSTFLSERLLLLYSNQTMLIDYHRNNTFLDQKSLTCHFMNYCLEISYACYILYDFLLYMIYPFWYFTIYTLPRLIHCLFVLISDAHVIPMSFALVVLS